MKKRVMIAPPESRRTRCVEGCRAPTANSRRTMESRPVTGRRCDVAVGFGRGKSFRIRSNLNFEEVPRYASFSRRGEAIVRCPGGGATFGNGGVQLGRAWCGAAGMGKMVELNDPDAAL